MPRGGKIADNASEAVDGEFLDREIKATREKEHTSNSHGFRKEDGSCS